MISLISQKNIKKSKNMIQTIKEFFPELDFSIEDIIALRDGEWISNEDGYNNTIANIEITKEKIVKFTILHVQSALKAASEKAYVEYIDLETNEIFDYTDVIIDDNVGANINKLSILNAYPLSNIK